MWPLPERSSEIPKPHKDTKENENNPPLPPLILTHDVDTRFGFEHIREACEVEKRLRFKSSWNIVPDLYEVDESVLDYLRNSSMEIGVHDWNHDGKLFSDKKIFDERVKKINQAIKEWGAKGFRAGMAFHHDEWMQELSCEYDSSHYDSDPYQPMGGGCGEIWPFKLGHLVELPYTMLQDHVLFVARGGLKVPRVWEGEEDGRKRNWEWIRRYIERNPQITQIDADYSSSHRGHRGRRVFKESGNVIIKGVDIWKMKAEWLVERGGIVLMITHPDYLCHPKLVRSREKGVGRRYDGWLSNDDRDVLEVRDKGIVGERWHGSVLEQYAAFLNWFKREFEGRYWHCLPWELARRFRNEPQTTPVPSSGATGQTQTDTDIN